MSETQQKTFNVGAIISADLTVPNAEAVRDFYKAVLGWQIEAVPMQDDDGEYADYMTKDAAGEQVGGVCHARGFNQDMPPQWMIYVNVDDVSAALQRCVEQGGKVLKRVEGDYFAVIQDPAGAVLAVTKVG